MNWENVAEYRTKWPTIIYKRLLKEQQEKLKRKTKDRNRRKNATVLKND